MAGRRAFSRVKLQQMMSSVVEALFFDFKLILLILDLIAKPRWLGSSRSAWSNLFALLELFEFLSCLNCSAVCVHETAMASLGFRNGLAVLWAFSSWIRSARPARGLCAARWWPLVVPHPGSNALDRDWTVFWRLQNSMSHVVP